MSNNSVKVVLIGKTGVGKSQLGNFILNRNYFKVGDTQNSETYEIQEGTSEINGIEVTIVDTPGLNDTEQKDENIMKKIVDKLSSDDSIDGIILVYSFREPRKVQKDQELRDNLYKIFGEDLLKERVKIIFTSCSTGEERDEEEIEKEEIQKKDIKNFLSKIVQIIIK